MEQVGCLDFAGVEAVGALLRADAFEGRAGRAEEREGAQSELGAQIARQHIDERSVAAMRVVEDNFLNPLAAMLAPRSRTTARNVCALTESVPGKPICSLLFP